jgi:hypothetical protein
MKTIYVATLTVLLSLTAAAQQPAAVKPPQPPTQSVPVPNVAIVPADGEQGGQPINVRLDVTVTDQNAQGALQPKSLMVMLVDRAMGQTRAAFQDRSIAVDARPTIVDGRIRLLLTIQSDQAHPAPGPQDPTLRWRNSFSLLLENGKPMVALETNDAATKRKLSIEAKATIQK